jgi:hypothetical protein
LALADRRTRGIFLEWRDKIAGDSARRQGTIGANPCQKGGLRYSGSRADKIWTADNQGAFRNRAPHHLHLPLLLGHLPKSRDSLRCRGPLMTVPASACANRKPASAFRSLLAQGV